MGVWDYTSIMGVLILFLISSSDCGMWSSNTIYYDHFLFCPFLRNTSEQFDRRRFQRTPSLLFDY